MEPTKAEECRIFWLVALALAISGCDDSARRGQALTRNADGPIVARMLAVSPAKNVRPREADQVALLEVGEYDYVWTYQNLAENAGLQYVKLPDAVDLGSPPDSATYALASVRVLGRGLGDSLTLRGSPILFAVTVPKIARRRASAERFVAFLLSPDGRRLLRSEHFDALDSAVVLGSGAPVLGLGASRSR